MILTERLKKVAEYVKNSRCLADIGTDHGYVPIFCVKNGTAKTAVASDVNTGPLKSAEKTLKNTDCRRKFPSACQTDLKILRTESLTPQ